MTPDQARALLDGTTPGPWEWADCDDEGGGIHMALRNPAGDKAVITADAESFQSEVRGTPADLRLAAAAPTLAAMIAGMREEWGVEMETNTGWRHWTNTDGCAPWFATREHAENAARLEPNPTRIVRRYVTTPEEVE